MMSENKNLKVIVVNNGKPEYRYIKYKDDDELLYELQNILGGYIEQVTVSRSFIILCNEDGRIKGLPYNCSICGVDFVGPIIVCSSNGEDWTDVVMSIDQFKRYLCKFGMFIGV